MNDINLKLKLFAGESVEAEGYGQIKPLTVSEVIRHGYTEYMQLLNVVCLETKDFIKDDEELKDINILDILIGFGGKEIEKQLETALSLFLGGEALIDKENLCVIVKFDNGDFNIVDSKNFNSIQETIKWQNYVKSFEEKDDSFNPANEEARKFKQRMDELKKQRESAKRKKNTDDGEDADIDFFDIVSSLASKSYGVNELNIGDLTIYQVYRKFKRLDAIDQYDISIKSIMAGSKNVKLKHWSSKLD